MFRIGVISDTHDFLDPKGSEIFARVDHILHGGDVGLPWLILELELIAPVTAVMGNTDDPALRYRLTETVELDGRKFLVHHILNPHAPEDSIKARIARDRPDVVVFGHTHKPFCEKIGAKLYFNPGYAGKSRFDMERSVAILHCKAGEIRPEYIPL
jgi:putative phosphoesterase